MTKAWHIKEATALILQGDMQHQLIYIAGH